MIRLVSLSVLLCLMAACTPSPARAAFTRASNAEPIQLWQDASIFELIHALIDTARHRVLVEVYEIGRPDLISQLVDARHRGLDVRLVTDPTVQASRSAAAELDREGVPELFYPVDDAAHQIDHVKLLIADGEAVVGGMNWGAHSSRNHDYVVDTRAPTDLDRLTQIFEQDWSLSRGRPSPLAPRAGDIGQTAPGHEIRAMLRRVMGAARMRILAEVYTFTDPDVIAALAAAHLRGVDVRILLDPSQPYNRPTFQLLRSSGVSVRWYPMPPGALLHAKAGLFDGELLLGSANWTYSGLDVNHELDVETADKRPVAGYETRFENDWATSPP